MSAPPLSRVQVSICQRSGCVIVGDGQLASYVTAHFTPWRMMSGLVLIGLAASQPALSVHLVPPSCQLLLCVCPSGALLSVMCCTSVSAVTLVRRRRFFCVLLFQLDY